MVLLLAGAVVPRPRPAGAGPRARRRHRPRAEPAAQSVVGARRPGRRGAAAEPGRQPRRRRHPQPDPGAEVRTMLAFLTRRLSAAALILLILSLVIFVLQHLSPGDPARAYVGANASPATVAAERQRLGLNDPFFTQYFRYLGGAVHRGPGPLAAHPATGDRRPGHLPARHRRTRRHRVRHRPDPGGVVRAVRCAALAGRVARPRRAAAVGDGAAVPAGARRHHRVLRPTRVAPGPGRRELRGSRADRHAGARHPAARADRRRSSTRCSIWRCRRWCCRSPRPSRSAGCCGRRCRACCTSTTCARPAPRA